MEKSRIDTFLEHFRNLKDPRINRKKLYPLDEILLVSICAVICGAEGWTDFVVFGNEKLEFLRTYLPFKNGIPSRLTFASVVRTHWGIENSLHWVLDVVFREDESRKREGNSAENMAIIRHTALNMLQNAKNKEDKPISIKALRKKAGWGNNSLAQILLSKF